MGVIFFILNAAFACILLFMVLFSSIISLASKNPDTRYQPMRDDRGSFIKSNPQSTTELDALGATARGDNKSGLYMKSRSQLEEDDESYSSGSAERTYTKSAEAGMAPPASGVYQPQQRDSGVPLFSGRESGQSLPPSYVGARSNSSSPAPSRLQTGYGGYEAPSPYRPSSTLSEAGRGFRQQQSGSPWQRGAGYD